jgi:anti-sigma factor RsiW
METGIHELTAAYALDALDEDERVAYEAHLPGCRACQDELAVLSKTTEALAIAASGPAPSPGLRERILAEARTEPQTVVPLERARSRRSAPVLAAVAAVAAVVAIGIGIWASQLSSDLDDTRAALERERTAAAVLADPEARTVELQQGDGRLVVGSDGRAVLVLDELDPAPADKTYEMWIVADGTPSRAGAFPGRDGLDVVALEGVVEGGDVVAVTVETKGGVEQPTSDPIVASQPV